MLGWTQEHGPYVIEDGDTKFTKNMYSWNKEASVIYFDSPAGVGYSVCGN
jgi:carboxypeptidase C (cathepsin A)